MLFRVRIIRSNPESVEFIVAAGNHKEAGEKAYQKLTDEIIKWVSEPDEKAPKITNIEVAGMPEFKFTKKWTSELTIVVKANTKEEALNYLDANVMLYEMGKGLEYECVQAEVQDDTDIVGYNFSFDIPEDWKDA